MERQIESTLLESAGGLVGAGRFERPTPCAQGRCATRLRYAPTFAGLFILNYFACRQTTWGGASVARNALRFETYQNISNQVHCTFTLRTLEVLEDWEFRNNGDVQRFQAACERPGLRCLAIPQCVYIRINRDNCAISLIRIRSAVRHRTLLRALPGNGRTMAGM